MATYTSPTQQHEEMAKKILARRGSSKSNDKPALKKTKAPTVTPTVTKAPAVDLNDPATHGNVPTNQYAGKSVKDLRAMCKAHEPKIKYTKKDTIAQLIAKLEA